jgi:hypothetical protein
MTGEMHTRRHAAKVGALAAAAALDARLASLAGLMAVRTGMAPGDDPFRGFYVTSEDVRRALDAPPPPAPAILPPLASAEPFTALARPFGLSARELDVVAVALAAEIDPKYEAIFGYLQDDVTRRRPSVALVLDILCDSTMDRLAAQAMFAPAAPLLASRLLRLAGDEAEPVGRRALVLAPGVAAFLLGEPWLPPGVRWLAETAGQTAPAGLARLARRAASSGAPLCLCFEGKDETEKQGMAAALGRAMAAPVMLADCARGAFTQDAAREDWFFTVLRDAALHHAVLYLTGLETISGEAARQTLLDALDGRGGVVILSASPGPRAGAQLVGMLKISFAAPDWPARRSTWRAALRARNLRAAPEALDQLAECFAFTRTEIGRAADAAASLAVLRGGAQDTYLFEAARGHSGHELASLTQRISPAHGWDDLVLPASSREQLAEMCRRVTLRHQVLGAWGFGQKHSGGNGVNTLFHGHSGTGKTMAAEVVARALQMDLYKIDLAGVVSKYIGETEKNLDRIFAAARDASAILFFDEADALFGKRSEVRDSHDRYANLEVSYLLQKMEQHDGVSILATNLRQNLDDAFLRRLAFTVQFPFPDEESRRLIWAGIWPAQAPVAADVDASWLGARFMLSGGNIRNAALAAAFFAAREGGAITLAHVVRAVQAEFEKMGKTLSPAELAPPVVALEAAA